MKIEWSDIAEADLDELYDYIARDVPYSPNSLSTG